MGKLIRFMIFIVIILGILVAFTLLTDTLVRQSVDIAKSLVVGKSIKGNTVRKLSVENARIKLPDTLVWRGVELDLETDRENTISNQQFKVSVPHLEVRVSDFLNNQCELSIPKINITPGPPAAQTTSKNPRSGSFQGLENGRFDLRFKLNLFQPFSIKDQVTSTVYNISSLFSQGTTPVPVNFSGILDFKVNGEPLKAMVYTKRRSNGLYALQINEEFFQTVAWFNTYDMTDAEAKLLSEYPFRMPRLVSIMDEAKQESERMAKRPNIPEDAYRHVLWSYLLTRAYGPDFAKLVTDAHEIGDPTNTEAEHQMDYNNNAVGRQYALDNDKQQNILRRLLNDKNVIREPQE